MASGSQTEHANRAPPTITSAMLPVEADVETSNVTMNPSGSSVITRLVDVRHDSDSMGFCFSHVCCLK